jgi:adenine C2-methylase RlmN of 23S rRNA A2503 and tRNA A37
MLLGLEENTEIIVLCRYKNDGSIYRQVANECNKNHPDRNPVAHNLVQELLKNFKKTGPVACKPCLACLGTIKWFVKLLKQKYVMVLRIQSYKIRISHTKEL